MLTLTQFKKRMDAVFPYRIRTANIEVLGIILRHQINPIHRLMPK